MPKKIQNSFYTKPIPLETNEIKALISLLDDDDQEVANMVEKKIKSLGAMMIPFLTNQWQSSFNPLQQKRIEEIVQELQFKQLVEQLGEWKNSESEDLLKGMWLIATYLHPDLSLQKFREQFNDLYFEAWLAFKPEMHPTDQIKTLNHVFFTKLKFGYNTKNLHSTANSMLNTVMDSKMGNPISLCVIYMLIAQRLNVPIYGVNLPNLFVLTYKTEQLQFYINVFNKGLVFAKNDIDNFIAQLKLPPTESFYQPCSNLDIIKRVLRNLIFAYEKTSETDHQAAIEKLIKVLG